MDAHRVPPLVLAYYDSTPEEDRLSSSADGALELLRTQELLRRVLPPAPARILDVGGGPGSHARWLTADGYQVHLVDPVPRHVERAMAIAGCTAELGDARRLAADDASYDVVLMLGPLYHLLERAHRDQALAEARRVLRPGGVIAAAAINRYASLFETAAVSHLASAGVQKGVARILRTGVHDGKGAFTEAYFHSGAELREEVSGAGFAQVEVVGVEGPAWAMLKAVENCAAAGEAAGSALFHSALAAARMAEPYPELLAASSHLLATGRRRP